MNLLRVSELPGQLRRTDHAYLNRLAVGEGQERGDVVEHHVRLMERPDDVLRHRVVDRDLAADTAVVGKDRRRDLHEADPPHEARRSKAGEIAYNAAPEGNDRRL